MEKRKEECKRQKDELLRNMQEKRSLMLTDYLVDLQNQQATLSKIELLTEKVYRNIEANRTESKELA